jgi:hypothetical protein
MFDEIVVWEANVCSVIILNKKQDQRQASPETDETTTVTPMKGIGYDHWTEILIQKQCDLSFGANSGNGDRMLDGNGRINKGPTEHFYNVGTSMQTGCTSGNLGGSMTRYE